MMRAPRPTPRKMGIHAASTGSCRASRPRSRQPVRLPGRRTPDTPACSFPVVTLTRRRSRSPSVRGGWTTTLAPADDPTLVGRERLRHAQVIAHERGQGVDPVLAFLGERHDPTPEQALVDLRQLSPTPGSRRVPTRTIGRAAGPWLVRSRATRRESAARPVPARPTPEIVTSASRCTRGKTVQAWLPTSTARTFEASGISITRTPGIPRATAAVSSSHPLHTTTTSSTPGAMSLVNADRVRAMTAASLWAGTTTPTPAPTLADTSSATTRLSRPREDTAPGSAPPTASPASRSGQVRGRPVGVRSLLLGICLVQRPVAPGSHL